MRIILKIIFIFENFATDNCIYLCKRALCEFFMSHIAGKGAAVVAGYEAIRKTAT